MSHHASSRALVLVALAVHALAAGAQHALAQDGAPSDPAARWFWPAGERWTLRLDLGIAPSMVRSETCDGCASAWERNVGGRAALGLVVHSHIVLGVEGAGAWDSRYYYGTRDRAPSVDIRAGYLQWYPLGTRHLALRAAAGPARYRLTGGARRGSGDWYFRDVRLEGTGLGLSGAWELWPNAQSRLGVTSYASWWHVPDARGTRQLPTRLDMPYRASFGTVQVGVGLTIR